MIKSIHDLHPGLIAEGFITSIKDATGVHVSFFGDVHGLIHKNDLRAFGVTAPSQAFKVGQVIRVRVVEVKENRISLSLRTKVDEMPGDIQGTGVVVGEITSGVVVRKLDDNIMVRLNAKNTKAEIVAALNVTHLSDHAENCSELFESYRKGDKIEEVLVLELPKRTGEKNLNDADGENSPIQISAKPLLLSEAKEGRLPSSLENIREEQHIYGYVSKVGTLGVFIRYLGGLTSLTPRANVADEWVNDPNHFFKKGQTVYAQVVHVNSKLKKFITTLKASAIKESQHKNYLFLANFLRESKFIHERKSNKDAKKTVLKVGQVINAHIVQNKAYGVILQLPSVESVGFCLNENLPTNAPTIGSNVECRILDLEVAKDVVDVSLRNPLLKVKKNQLTEHDKVDVLAGKRKAVVELIKPFYAVLSLPDFGNKIAFAPLYDCNGRLQGCKDLQLGLLCDVQVEKIQLFNELSSYRGQVHFDEFEEIVGVKIASSDQSQRRIRARSESLTVSGRIDIGLGALVRVQIRDIKGTNMRVDLLNVRRKKKHKGMLTNIHCCDVFDDDKLEELHRTGKSIFSSYSIGAILNAKIVGINKLTKNGAEFLECSLSLRTSDLESGPGHTAGKEEMNWEKVTNLSKETTINGFIVKVVGDGIVVAISRSVVGFVFCTDVSRDVEFLERVFNSKEKGDEELRVGSPVKVRVLRADKESETLDLTMLVD